MLFSAHSLDVMIMIINCNIIIMRFLTNASMRRGLGHDVTDNAAVAGAYHLIVTTMPGLCLAIGLSVTLGSRS